MHVPRRSPAFVTLTLSLVLMVLGCTSTMKQPEPPDPYHGQLTLYLNGPREASLDITFRLGAVNVIAADGTPATVSDSTVSVNSMEMKGRQLSLGERDLPEGGYTKVQLAVEEAWIKKEGRSVRLEIPSGGIEIAVNASIEKRTNTTLFLLWDPDASVREGRLFDPAFAVRGEGPQLLPLLLYVTNEGSDNVSVINRQTEEVVATVKTGRKPRGVATSTGRERPRVFVVNSGSDSITVIDPATNTVEDEIPIRFGRKPEDIAAARVSEEVELLFVTNYGSDTVSVVDAVTFEEIENVRVGSGPAAVAVDPPLERFLDSRFLSSEDIDLLKSFRKRFLNVYVVNQNSRSISVLRLDIKTNRVERDVASLPLEWGPAALSVDPRRAKVYVANHDSDRVSVVDIMKVIRGDTATAVGTISNVGGSGIGIITDPALDRLYLLKEASGEMTLLRPPSRDFDPTGISLPPIVGSVAVGELPRDLLLDPEGRTIYVVNRGSGTVSAIDKTTRREKKVIPVGKRPYGIAMFP